MNKELKKISEELIEDVKEESKLMTLFKRMYVIIIVLVMVFLLMVNTNFGYHLVSLFSGRIVSSTLNQDYSFDLKFGGHVHFQKEILLILQQMYKENKKTEFKACLIGRKEGVDYFVTDIYEPFIYDKQVFSVTSQICNSETIISLHSHPPLRCIFSEQDITSFNMFKQVNNDGIIALMCGEEMMTFFGYENV